jgi:UDP-glucose 4-epimerase
MRTVLVTGAASWEGAQLVRRLAARDDTEVVAVDDMAPQIPLPVPLRRWSLDSLDFARWVIDVGPDAVVHLQTMDRAGSVGASRARESVVLGAQALFGALARLPHLRSVVVGSNAAVYGTGPRHATIADERTPLAGRATRHERALREVERFVGQLDDELPDTAITVLRFTEAYGSTVDTPLARFLRLPVVPVIMGHDPLLQLLAAEDVTRCLEHALDAEVPGTFNVAPERPLYLSQVLRLSGAGRTPLVGFQLDAAYRALSSGGLTLPEHHRNLLRHGRVLRVDAMVERLGFRPLATTRSVVSEAA